MVANWADLPDDLLVVEIGKRFNAIEDYSALAGVCTSWRKAAKDHYDMSLPQVPLLMLADKDDNYREFYAISKGKVSWILYLPEARGRSCHPSSDGWMVTMSDNEDFNGEFNLLHPFSHTQISLPSERNLWALQGVYDDFPKPRPFSRCIHKAVLSANPSLTSDHTLVISYYTDTNHLAFWRPKDLNWTKFEIEDRIGGLSDIIYCKGQFYCVTWAGEICSFDIAGASISQPIVQSRTIGTIGGLQDEDHMFLENGHQYYLVDVLGVLFLVTRFSPRDIPEAEADMAEAEEEEEEEEEAVPETCVPEKFKVYELDLIKFKYKETRTLRNSAIFLGINKSTSIDCSKFPGVKPNHIYFTDDWDEVCIDIVGGDGRHTGVYNLEDGNVESFYPKLSRSFICPPTWVTPSF